MATTIYDRPRGGLLREAKVRVDYTELIDASTTQTIDLLTMPNDAFHVTSWIDNVTAMTDAGSISACTIQVGVTAVDTDALVPAFDLFGSTGRVHIDGANTTIDSKTITALFTATGANLGDGSATGLDTGVVDVYIVYGVLS